MNESKATPGPWKLREGFAGGLEVYPDIKMEPPFNARFNASEIASVSDAYDNWRTNARLIAAAPDMLSALRRAVLSLAHICESDGNDAKLYGDTYRIVSDAIAKATRGSA